MDINVEGAWEYILYVWKNNRCIYIAWLRVYKYFISPFVTCNVSFICCSCLCANASYAQCLGLPHSVAEIAMCSHFERIKNALKTQTQKHFLCAFLFLLYTCSVCSSFLFLLVNRFFNNGPGTRDVYTQLSDMQLDWCAVNQGYRPFWPVACCRQL